MKNDGLLSSFRFIWLVLLLFWGLSACAPKDTQDDNAAPTATPALPPGTLVDLDGQVFEPEPQPPDFLELLVESTEDDPDARQQAILAALRVLAGERSPSEVYAGEEVTFDMIWLFTSLLKSSYDQSQDEDFKREVERLVAALFPSDERMLPYAELDDESAVQPSRSPGVMASPARQIDCAAIRADGFPAPGDGAAPVCQLYRQFTADGRTYRVFYPEEMREDAAFMQYVEAALAALRDSQSAYREYSEVPGATVVFTTLASPQGPRVGASTVNGELNATGCSIAVFPFGRSLEIPDFKQIIAHEIFHCVSLLRKGEGFDRASWWYVEGMAEHFSNVVYPDNDLEIRLRLPQFDAKSATDSLLTLDYENFIFFQYLENRSGNAYNIALLDALPTGGSPDGQINALAAFDDMQVIFHEFGKAYLNSDISDTSGASINPAIYMLAEHRYDFSEGGSAFLTSQTMVVSRYSMKFERGQEYDLIKEFNSQEGKLSWRPEDRESFEEVPDNLALHCEEPETYLTLFTSLPSGAGVGGSADLDFEAELAEEKKMDCCLVGTWEQLAAENQSNLQTVLGGDMLVSGTSGRSVLAISGNRTTTMYLEGYTVMVLDPDGETITMNLVGGSSGTFILPEDLENVIQSTGDSAAFVMTQSTGGESVSYPIAFPGGISAGSAFEYSCSDTELTTFPGGLAPFYSSTYRRISDIPEPPPPDVELPPPPGAGGDSPPDFGAADACMALSASSFTSASSSVSWELQNDGAVPAVITSISLNWPAENGAWLAVSIDGVDIWTGSSTFSPGVLEEALLGDEGARTIPPEGRASITLRFANDSVGSTGYILVLDYNEGCISPTVE